MELKVANPYKNDGKVDYLPPYRQLGPGPCNSSPTVMNALMNQPIVFTNEYFYTVMNEVQEMTKYVYQTKNQFTLAGQFSGNGGNEALLVNLTDPGETIVVATSGLWGAKVANMGRRYALNVIELATPPGEVYTLEELEREIIKSKPVALFITHGESSGGTLQPLKGLGAICHKHNCLLIVDAVISLGVVPLLVDEWEIDAANAGVQKGLGAPSGLCLLTLNDQAYKRMLSKKHPVPYILDLKMIGYFWSCYGKPRRYVCTYGFHMLTAVRQALIEVCQEGLENVWDRHQKMSNLFMNKVMKMGCKDFITNPKNRFCGTNCVILPKDINWLLLLDFASQKHKVEFGYGIGPTAGKTIRIGFLAQNAKPEIVEHFLKVLEEGFEYCRKYPERAKDCSVAKCMKHWDQVIKPKL